MHATESIESPTAASSGVGPAVVLATEGRSVVVRTEEEGVSLTATLSADTPELRAGDRVLIARGSSGAWVISVLGAIRPAPLLAADGTEARLEDGVLSVRDTGGRLIFEHRADEGLSVIHAPHGDLRLSAPGTIELDAKKDIKIRGGREASLGRTDDNALRFDRRGAHLKTRLLEASAAVARLALIDTTFAAARVTSAVETAKHTVGVLDTNAKRIVTRAKSAFTDVDGLSQSRVGRLRQIASGSAQLIASTLLVKAKEDVSIKGDKIHLA